MNTKGVIYKYTSKTTNKSYVGQALYSNLENRKNRHKTDKIDTHFYRARDKYGYDDFEFSLLEENILKENLSEREIFWIAELNTMTNGYNSTIGGEGGNTYAKRSEEQMLKTKLKLSKTNKGANNGQSKQVKLYNVITKEIITFDTYTEAANYIKLSRHAIKRIVDDNHITKSGWCKYENNNSHEKRTIINKNVNKKTVTLYNILNKEIITFETIKKASEYTTLGRRILSNIINFNKISKTGWCLYFKGVETIESVADYKKLVICE